MRAGYWSYWLARQLSAAMSPAAAVSCAERLADLSWLSGGQERAAVAANLSVLLKNPKLSQAAIGREVFRNFGRYLAEFFTMHRVAQPHVAVDGHAHLLEARRRGRGAIILTAHLGNWELGAVILKRMGYEVTAVALPHQDARLDRLFNRQRESCGIRVVPLGRGAMRESLRALHAGHFLGLLGDWEFTGHGVRVPMHAGTMMLPKGPAVLSVRVQAPIVPTFLLREGPWTFRLCVEPPLWPERHDREERSVTKLVHAHAEIFARYLGRFPEQWLIFEPAFGVN